MVCEGYFEATGLHDTNIVWVAIVLINPDLEGIDLVQDDDRFVIDALGCAKNGSSRYRAVIFRAFNVEAKGKAIYAVPDLARELREHS